MKKFISILFILNIFIAAIFADVRGIGAVSNNGKNNSVNSNGKIELVVNQPHSKSITRICYTYDGKYIASSDNAGNIKIWNADNNLLLRTISIDTKAVFWIDFIPNSYTLVSTHEWNDKLYFWNIKTGTYIKTITVNSNMSKGFSFSPDGKNLYISNSYIEIYDTNTGSLLKKIDDAGIPSSAVVCSSDGKYIASGCKIDQKNNVINIWSALDNFKLVKTVKCYDYVSSLAFSPDCRYLLFGSGYTTAASMKLWDIKTDSIIYDISYDESIDSVAFTPGGKYFICGKGDFFETSTGKKVVSLYDEDDSGGDAVCFSPDGNYVVVGKYDELFKFNLNNVSIKTKIGPDINVNAVGFTGNKSDIVATSDYGILIYDLNTGLQSCILDKENSYTRLAVENNRIFPLSTLNGTKIINSKTYKVEQTIKNEITEDSFSVSSDGKYIVFGKPFQNEISIHSLLQGKKIKTLYSRLEGTSGICFSPDSKYFATIDNDNKNFLTNSISIWSIEKNNIIKTVNMDSNIQSIKFSPNGNYLLTGVISEERGIRLYNLSTEKEVAAFGSSSNSLCYSNNGKYIANGTHDGDIEIWDIENIKLLKTLKGHKGIVGSVSFSKDGKRLVSCANDNTIKVWSVGSGELLATILNAPNGEYISYTPEGFFTGTEWATKNLVYLVDGLNIIELDQMYDKLYRPDLIAAKLQGQDISAYAKGISLSDIAASGAAPAVNILNKNSTSQSRDIMLDFSVTDKGGGIGSVNYSVNGKVYRYSDGLKSSKGQTFTCSIPVTLDSGNNLIQVFAMNGANEISSKKALLNLTWNGNVNRPNLFVMTVAVNNYRDSGLKLNYCVNDADSLEKALLVQNGSLYNRVVVESLRDKDVTKQNLVKKFNDLSNKVSPDDVFVFFISGHGTTYNDGDYYFIPYDYLGTRADSLVTDAVSKNDLLKNLSLVKAKKSLVLLDTCSSGAFASDKGQRGMTEKTAIDRLANATGQAVIAACSDNQFAMEGYNGHGLFTYVLLDAMKGGADRNNDGFISMQELSSYIGGEVISRSEQKWGYAQVPYSSLTASEFPLFSVSGNSASLSASYSNGNSNIIQLNGLNASTKDKITTISGKGLNYSFDGRNWSISASRIQNEDKTVSGDLRLSIWLSDHIWERRKYSGHRMASIIYEHLEPQYGYSNISREIESTNENPESGMYYVVFCIEEYSSDGKWYVSTYLTFDNKIKWTQKQNYTIYN